MNNTLLKVVQATSTTKNNYCIKLQSKTEVTIDTAFGICQSSRQVTYYVFMESAPEVGLEAELDLDMFDVVEKSHVAADNTPITLKYLYPKR